MLLHEISFAREFQSYTVNSFSRHSEYIALLSLLSLRLFRVMAAKQKQARTNDTYVAWLISVNGEMILRQHFYSLWQNQKFGTGDGGDIVEKTAPTIFDNTLIETHGVNKNLKADLALPRQRCRSSLKQMARNPCRDNYTC